jgi:hypothetical protein
MKYQTLNSDEKIRLVNSILESIEEPIEFDEFQETIGLMIENIPGMESLSDDLFSALVNDCWEIFLESSLPFSDKS